MPQGRTLFSEELNASKEENITFLMDVIERSISVSPQHTPGKMREKDFWQVAKEVGTTYKPLLKHFISKETRNPVCDHLETFDVKAKFPIEDLIFPEEAFGRTLRKQMALSRRLQQKHDPDQFVITHRIDPRLEDDIKQALKLKDDKILGKLLERNPDKLGRFLFPRARSLELEFIGEKGSLSGTHLSPLKMAEHYIEY